MMESLEKCAASPDRLSTAAMHGILWTTLVAFVALGTGHALWLAVRRPRDRSEKDQHDDSIDAFLSGRGNIADWRSLGVSLFSSAMGQWVLFFTPYIGYTQGWYGIIGQSLAWIVGLLLIRVFSPYLRRQMHALDNIYAVTDWIRVRYSRAFQIYVSIFIFFVLIVLAGVELATIADVYYKQMRPNASGSSSMPFVVISAVSIAVYLYTALNGFSSTVFTDFVQGVLIVILTIPVMVGILTSEKRITAENIRSSSQELATMEIFRASLASTVSLIWAVLLDFTLWQRMFCVREERITNKALLLGAVLIISFLTFLGTIGLLMRNVCDGIDSYNIIFIFAEQHGTLCIVVSLVLLTTLVTSTLDSFLYAGLSMVSAKIAAWDAEMKDSAMPTAALDVTQKTQRTKRWDHVKALCAKRFYNRTFFRTNAFLLLSVIAVGVMSIIVQQVGKVMVLGNIFFVINVLQSTLVLPIFAGIFLPITNAGALSGAVSGILTCFFYGLVEFEGQFMAGLEMIGLMIFINDTTRQALEHKFCLIAPETSLCDKATIAAINNGTLDESKLPQRFDDDHYRPFVRQFPTEVQAMLDDPKSEWAFPPDLVMRPRTVILFILVPLVTLVVSYVVSLCDPHKKTPDYWHEDTGDSESEQGRQDTGDLESEHGHAHVPPVESPHIALPIEATI
eukprot:GEMP01019458.1.p1 GENE.GEMP01019458.1~~GEMP01019458.1.p1  ORF type:complete len:677 (+),score=157.19 GEMP01019458.1:68-2098(+)